MSDVLLLLTFVVVVIIVFVVVLSACHDHSSSIPPECGMASLPTGSGSTCESAASSLSDWLAANAFATATSTANCNPVTWNPPTLFNQSGASANCRTSFYTFSVSFAPGGTAYAVAPFQTTVGVVGCCFLR